MKVVSPDCGGERGVTIVVVVIVVSHNSGVGDESGESELWR